MAIELRDIVKRFPGVVANDGIDLTVRRGTVHAVVGENGAGKSTLMKILYGMQKPDEGTIAVNGTEVRFRSPRDAIEAGIGMVHQHFMLADNFTVAENIILGDEPTRLGILDRRGARQRISDLARAYGLSIDPRRRVQELGVGERQRVEILKVLYRGAQILILDEPTAVLVPQEVDELFASLKDLTAEGVTVIFISHKLDEVLRVAGAITVIRAGRTVAEVSPDEVTARDLAELMVGRELPSPEARDSPVGEEVVVEVEGLTLESHHGPVDDPATGVNVERAAPIGPTRRKRLDDITFRIRSGEILGVAGVEGNGQSELIDVLLGVEHPDAGRIVLEGRDVTGESTRQRRRHGVGCIPEDRQRDGLLLAAPLWENVMLGHQTSPPCARGPWIDRAGARARTADVVERYSVRTPGVDVAAFALSGGNQQKLIVGREMEAGPRMLIAAHPTRGIDVGAQAAVWASLKTARDAGLAVLLISADLEELVGLSDELVVMLRGRIVARVDPRTVTLGELGEYMTGARGAEDAA